MDIIRVIDPDGSHVEPPLDQSWSDLEKLQWCAAVTSFDGDINVTVEQVDRRLYEVRAPGSGKGIPGPWDYQDCWEWLIAMKIGAELHRDHAQNGA